MSEHEASHEQGASHEHDDVHNNYRLFLTVSVLLVIATAASYWTFTDLWPFGESKEIKRLWMMAVSCFKASLVIIFFMHLKWEANWKWILTVPASFMCVLLTLALGPDVGMRVFNGFSGYSRERLMHSAELPHDKAGQHHADVKHADAKHAKDGKDDQSQEVH